MASIREKKESGANQSNYKPITLQLTVAVQQPQKWKVTWDLMSSNRSSVENVSTKHATGLKKVDMRDVFHFE